jgi:hypothetical protein
MNLVPARDRPLLVAIIGQEPFPVEVDRAGVLVGIAGASRAVDRGTERIDVNPQTFGRKTKEIPDGRDHPRPVFRIERPARLVHGLAQIRGRSPRIELRPQRVHELLAMKPMSRRQREQLQNSGRLPPPPYLVRNDMAPNRDAEAAE